jgi:hypothetical protein
MFSICDRGSWTRNSEGGVRGEGGEKGGERVDGGENGRVWMRIQTVKYLIRRENNSTNPQLTTVCNLSSLYDFAIFTDAIDEQSRTKVRSLVRDCPDRLDASWVLVDPDHGAFSKVGVRSCRDLMTGETIKHDRRSVLSNSGLRTKG